MVILSHIKTDVLIWVSLYFVSLRVCSTEPGLLNRTSVGLGTKVVLMITLENKHRPCGGCHCSWEAKRAFVFQILQLCWKAQVFGVL